MSEQSQEPKILVDEDWKSKVEAEKRAATEAKPVPPEATAEKQTAVEPKPARPEAAAEKRPDQESGGYLPATSFMLLVSSLFAQSLAAMGKSPDPQAGHAVVRPDVAKHYIDILAMLEEKTKGNLTPDEAGMLSEALHHLRMLFISVRGQQAVTATDK